MNYLAHALPFLDDPYFVAGTATPDWLSVANRRARVRKATVLPFCEAPDPVMAAFARGTLQHLADDAKFHASRAFAELSLRLTVLSRDALGGDDSLRPSFLGHLLVEVLLDATLGAADTQCVDRYYELLDQVDPARIEAMAGQMCTHHPDRLAWFVGVFRQERILWDYFEDGKLMRRLNQVMRRVGVDALPEDFQAVLDEARQMVGRRSEELLEGIPADTAAG